MCLVSEGNMSGPLFVDTVSEPKRLIKPSPDNHLLHQSPAPPSFHQSQSPTPPLSPWLLPPNSSSTNREWLSSATSQNLSALLNDPHRTRNKRDFFTRTWGDSFVPPKTISPNPSLPVVEPEEFIAFLKRTSKRYRKFERRRRTSSTAAFSNRRDSSCSVLPSADLSNVPRIFFSQSFDLSQPSTFQQVFPSEGNIWSLSPSTGRLAQEVLSHHLDNVEISIAGQVAQKSTAFFEAVLSHDVIMERLSEASEQTRQLRSFLRSFDSSWTPVMVSVHVQKRRLAHLRATLDILRIMSTVRQTQPTIQLLLSEGDFLSALELIETSQDILDNHLEQVHCFRHLNSQLEEMDRVIGVMLENDFVNYVALQLNRPVEDEEVVDEVSGDKILAVLLGLLKRKDKSSFLQRLREESATALKVLVKQLVAEAVSKTDRGETTNAESLLSELGVEEWIAFIRRSFLVVRCFLGRLRKICERVLEAVEVRKAQEEEDEVRMGRVLAGVMRSAVDEAQEKTARLLSSFQSSASKLSPTDFITLNDLCQEFTRESNRFPTSLLGSGVPVSGSSGVPAAAGGVLAASLQSVASKFVATFHAAHRAKLELLLRGERWQLTEVPEEIQKLVDRLCSPSSLSQGFRLRPRLSKEEEEEGSFEEGKAFPHLTVDGEPYAVVGVCLILIRMVAEYCEFGSIGHRRLSEDLLMKLSDLLMLFNSKMSQLLLGAQAMEAAGLKNITIRNLALGWRCLQLLFKAILPRVRTLFAEKLTEPISDEDPRQNQPPQANFSSTRLRSLDTNLENLRLRSLDNVIRDLETHGAQIHSMILSISESSVRSYLEKWELKAPIPSQPIKAVCRQLVKVHEALDTVLPQAQVEEIFRKIHEAFLSRIRHQVHRKLALTNDGGPQAGLLTAELTFYREQMKSLKCFPTNSKLLTNLTQEVWSMEGS